MERLAQEWFDRAQILIGPDESHVRDALIALPYFDKIRCAYFAPQVNYHSQSIPHHRQVGKDAGGAEQCVPVTRNYLHDAETIDRGLKFSVKGGKLRWPVFK
jgi:hypothetical protein